MPDKYTVTILNQTGTPQNYIFFAAPPRIHGAQVNQLWSNVITSAPGTESPGIGFEVSPNYLATCGQFRGEQQRGTGIAVAQTVPVQLGKAGIPGTTIDAKIQQEAVYLGKSSSDSRAGDGCFELNTGTDFTPADVENTFIGVAVGGQWGDYTAIASFSPSPGLQYHIQPQQIFYVASGQRLDIGSLVDPEAFDGPPPFKVDFGQQTNITVTHDRRGQFHAGS